MLEPIPDDATEPEPRAVIVITISYDGVVEAETHSDPGDECMIADAMREMADHIAAQAGAPKQQH